MKLSVPVLIAATVLLPQGCELIHDPSFPESSYPTSIRPLPPAQLETLRNEYAELNEKRICTSLDQFGFPDYSLTPCLGRPVLRIPITEDVETAVAKAKLVLVRNSKFTNVTDTAWVALSRFFPLEGCIKCDGSAGDIRQIQWKFEFANQWYDGLEVLESNIIAFADAEGVFMLGGNMYGEINVPRSDMVTFDDAKALLRGRELHFSDWTGPKTYVITEDSFPPTDGEGKVILPIIRNETRELRVAWKVPIGKGTPWWFIYVDSTTGEVIREEMLIVF